LHKGAVGNHGSKYRVEQSGWNRPCNRKRETLQQDCKGILSRLGEALMFDLQCAELARYFLTDEEHTEEEVYSLAQEIQDSIERWFAPRGDRPKQRTP